MDKPAGDLALLARSRRRKTHAHSWPTPIANRNLDLDDILQAVCIMPGCGVTRADYEARVRRGRTSLRAGKDGERAIAKAYGGQRVGQYGGASDVVVGELFSVQSKVGWFSERFWTELQKLPRTGGRIPTLIVADRPGPGRKTRRLVVRLMEDDIALHGEKP